MADAAVVPSPFSDEELKKTSDRKVLEVATADELTDPRLELEALKEALLVPGLETWFIDCLIHRMEWLATARPKQLPPPGDWWRFFLMLAGRGFGKSRAAAEEAFWYAVKNPGVRVAVIAPTINDLRRICFEGDSGLMGIIPKSVKDHPDFKYNRALFELHLPNGSKFEGFSSEAPERLRGPQFHFHWWEEMAAWANLEETYNQALFTLRLKFDANGKRVRTRAVASTTPKPWKLIIKLVNDKKRVAVVRGSSYENKDNLDEAMLETIKEMEGTDLGKQEIFAEILDFSDQIAVPRKSWKMWPQGKKIPLPEMIVVALDPASEIKKENDSSACVVWGVCRVRVVRKHAFLDTTVSRASNEWIIILLDSWKEKLLYPDLRKKFKATVEQWKQIYRDIDSGIEEEEIPVEPVVERASSGLSLIPDLMSAGLVVHPFEVQSKSKKFRVGMIAEAFRNGRVAAPGHINENGEIVFFKAAEAVVKQYDEFTGIDDGRPDSDDLVDAGTAGLHYIRSRGYLTVKSDENYYLRASQEELDEIEETYEPIKSLYG